MTILPSGINKTLTIARESTFGVLSTASGQLLRRTNESMNLSKDSFINQEILPSGQYRDLRHGVNRPAGSLSGNLAPSAYTEVFENLLCEDFSANTPGTLTPTGGVAVTVTTASPPIGIITISAGTPNFTTQGFLVGQTVRMTGFTGGSVGLNNVNFLIVGFATNSITVAGPSGYTMISSSTQTGVTIAAVGHSLWMPATGRNDNSFTLERNFTDASIVETFLGCKVSQISLNVPASGFLSFSAMLMAQSMATGTTSNFATPAALDTASAVDASTGVLEIGISGVPTGAINITGVQLQIAQAMQPQPAVGTNTVPYLPRGRLSVSGQLTAYFVDTTYRNIFIQELLSSLTIVATTSPALNADFVTIHMPVVKFQSADKTDSDSAMFQTISFTALENATGTTGTVPSTLMIQDSTA